LPGDLSNALIWLAFPAVRLLGSLLAPHQPGDARVTPPSSNAHGPADRKEIVRVFEERRRWIRIDVAARLITTAPAAPQPDVAVMDLNPTGFHIATVDPVPVAAVFVSDVTMADGLHPRARVAYCRPQPADGHDGGFVSRLDFVD